MLRKAQGSPIKLISMVGTVFLIFFSIFLIVVPLVGDYYVRTDFSIRHLEYDVISSRITGAPECLAFEDDLGKVHTGVIDLRLFNTQRIKECSATKISLDFNDGQKSIDVDWGEREIISRKVLVRYTEDGINFDTGVLEVTW
jgi:hypothetical protein